MSETIMGMGIVVEVLGEALSSDIDEVLLKFHKFDDILSPYRRISEIYKINTNKLRLEDTTPLTKKILALCEDTRKITNGFFDISVERHIDPSGLVVGYAISECVEELHKKGYKNFYIAAGNDLYISGHKNAQKWKVELPNPYPLKKRSYGVYLSNLAMSTSGQGSKGIVVYNPLRKKIVTDVLSFTVIAKNSLDADRFSTAAFAMGEKGIDYIEKMDDLEGYLVMKDGKEAMTSGFNAYLSL